jgi:hypothetical protein
MSHVCVSVCVCAGCVFCVCALCVCVCVCVLECVMCHVLVQVLGHTWEEALSLAHVVSSLNAQSQSGQVSVCVCIIYICI